MRYSDQDVAARGVKIFGTKPPFPIEIATARRMLDAEPDGLTPI
jgi:hypothetical protein